MAGHFPVLAAYSPFAGQGNDLHRISTNSATKSDLDEKGSSTGQTSEAFRGRPRGGSKSYRKLVFTDPVAFRYLEEDESTTVLARRHKLEGYELYIVEQWVVSRSHATFTICTHTGDSNHSILVNVLAVPHDQSTWSKRLQIYFGAVSQSYAKEKETHLGTLMVTNLSGFPSALNVIAVPDGDVRKHREDFIVNENLKRMGCTGRAAMNLQYPPTSTVQKFHRIYRTSERVPLYSSVMELVRFCQMSLVLYGKLDPTYADGLLCDITEKATNAWWNEIGIDFHNFEPSDGVLGPTTVAALIGLIIGGYNRLKETGAPVGKDPLDLPTMKRAIGHFQKMNRMERSRRLDRATLDRLHRVTANKAEDEGLAVTRALKSTVGAFSGKGGEMIARGLGGGKEKAGIAEVETLDIERFAQLVIGRSMKWLWQGKDKGQPNVGAGAPVDELNGRVFSTDDQGNFIWTSETKNDGNDVTFVGGPDPEEKGRRTGRLRDAVGLSSNRNHGPRSQHTDDEGTKHDRLAMTPAPSDVRRKGLSHQSSHSTLPSEFPPLVQDLANAPITTTKPEIPRDSGQTQAMASTNPTAHRQALRGIDHKGRESPSKRRVHEVLSRIRDELRDDRYQNFSANFRFEQPQTTGLKRSLSTINLRTIQEARTAKLPRHLSYSILTDAIDYQKHLAEDTDADDEEKKGVTKSVSSLIKIRKEQLRRSQELGVKVFGISRGIAPFAQTRIGRVEKVEREAVAQLEELNNVYYGHLEEYQTLQATSTDLVAREKASLNEAMRSIDMLGQKLDYEIDSLQSRMHEVEESIDDFERRVMDIEASIRVLVAQEEKPRQASWYERWLTFGRTTKMVEQERKEVSIAEDSKAFIRSSARPDVHNAGLSHNI